MSNENNNVPVYAEPEGIDYIIIKVRESVINGERGGSLYETTRKAWHARLDSAMPYKYVLSVVGGIVQEVYHVSRWYTCPTEASRIEFEGEVAEFKVRNLFVGKMIPECYRVKGLASPFLYKKKTGAPTVEPAAPIEKNEIEKPAITPKTESESKIKVHGKAKGWTALGIIDAYTKIHPSATVEDINKAFPRELFASTKTYKNIVIDRKVYWQEAVDAGKEQDYEWLKKSREDGAYYFTLEDGTEVTFYKIVWSEDIFPKIVEHAKTLGIEVASFEDIGRGKGRGDYEIEYLPNFSFHVDGRMTVSTLQRQFRDAFNAGLRVYEPSGKKAHPKAVLAKLRTINDATEVGEFEASNDMKVMEFEYKMKSIFGINVQVALLDDSKLSRDDSPLKDAGKI